jgi:hypothetical protein
MSAREVEMKLLAIQIALFVVTPLASTEPRVIPLKDIWAYHMPGTRRVSDLDAVKQQSGITKHPIVSGIVRSLAAKRPNLESIGPALIVQGTAKEALRNTNDIFTKFREPSSKFSLTDELNLVFYTTLGGPYTHIESIERTGPTIVVRYRLVSHNTREDTLHFALIPLGRLDAGTYEVKIESMGLFDETGARKEPSDKSKLVICTNTTFEVTEATP